MKKILHVFPKSLFTNSYFDFIDSEFNNYNHEFVITDIGAKTTIEKKYCKKFKITNLSTFKLSDTFILNKILKNNSYDLVILHSVYLNYLLLPIIKNKKILEKTIITLWGGSDSKKFAVTKENMKYCLQSLIYENIRKNLFKRVKYIASIIPQDYNNIKDLYNFKAKYLECKYFIPTNKRILNKKVKKRNNIINIQVGHSGSIESNTIEVLEILKKYKEENINIYCPLSYGNEEYIKKIINYGKKNFGYKFKPITKLMSSEKFAELIKTMDVLIMNTKVQQGLGNIYSYFYMGKKVYLNSNGELWSFFKNEDFTLNSIGKIKNLSLTQLILQNEKDVIINKDKSKSQFDNSKIKKIWKNIFDKGCELSE